MQWVEISITTTEEATEAISEIFNSNGTAGVVIDDPSLWNKKRKESKFDEIWDMELAPEDHGGVIVKGYLPANEFLEDKLAKIQTLIAEVPSFGLDLGKGEIKLQRVEESDWANAWKAYFKPEHIGKLVIKPTWEEYEAKEGELIIHLDPGMAFGTGTHETTSMCLAFLQRYVKENDLVYDVGTGSGILSIAALLLGARHAWACDVDAVAVKVAKDNAELNEQADKIEIELGSLEQKEEKADLIVSNIVANIIIMLGDNYAANIKKDGILLTSGIISERENDVKEKLTGAGFVEIEREQKGDWVCLAWRKE